MLERCDDAAAELARDTFAVLGRELVLSVPTAAAEMIVERALSSRGGYCCFVNAHSATLAEVDPEFARSLDEAWALFPDGAPVAWLMRRLGAPAARRLPGPDVMPLVIDVGRSRGLRHFLFGSNGQVLESLASSLHSSYPGAEICGRLSPPVGPLALLGGDEIIEAIRVARPHVVWCGLGAPRQELWMRQNAHRLSPALVLGVGAAFDFVAATKRRAPGWIQATGLEWAHRLAHEPRRLASRYLRSNTIFALIVGRELLRSRACRSAARRASG